MSQRPDARRSADPGAILTGYRWVATLFALLVILQAFLGMRGFVGANEGLVTAHEMTANLMFLLAIAQTVLAWLLYTRSAVTIRELVLNGLLIFLTIAQIGLGYSTRGDSFVTTVSLHVPNGVLLMGVSTVVTAMAWQIGTRTPAATTSR